MLRGTPFPQKNSRQNYQHTPQKKRSLEIKVWLNDHPWVIKFVILDDGHVEGLNAEFGQVSNDEHPAPAHFVHTFLLDEFSVYRALCALQVSETVLAHWREFELLSD